MAKKIEAKGTIETTHKVMNTCGQVFRYAIASGRCERNPVTDLRGAIKARPAPMHMNALAEKDLPDLLRKMDAYATDNGGEQQTRLALDVLKQLKEINGAYRLVFPGTDPARPMSKNTVLFALYRMGYRGRMTGHGFRAIASTILNEIGFDADVIERQLAHAERNKVRAAYHRTEYLPERRKMMQQWANYLDRRKNSAICAIKQNHFCGIWGLRSYLHP